MKLWRYEASSGSARISRRRSPGRQESAARDSAGQRVQERPAGRCPGRGNAQGARVGRRIRQRQLEVGRPEPPGRLFRPFDQQQRAGRLQVAQPQVVEFVGMTQAIEIAVQDVALLQAIRFDQRVGRDCAPVRRAPWPRSRPPTSVVLPAPRSPDKVSSSESSRGAAISARASRAPTARISSAPVAVSSMAVTAGSRSRAGWR